MIPIIIRLCAFLCVLCVGTQESSSNDSNAAAIAVKESRSSNENNASKAAEESDSNDIAVGINMTMGSLRIQFPMDSRRMPASEKAVSY
jgi:hypothetical protein